MHDPSLVSSVDLEELARAQELYRPYALEGKQPIHIEDQNERKPLTEFYPFLAATMPHFKGNELFYHLKELNRNIHSNEYFRNVFRSFVYSQFDYGARDDDKMNFFAVFDCVDAQLEALPMHTEQGDKFLPRRAYCQSLLGIIEKVEEQFACRTAEAKAYVLSEDRIRPSHSSRFFENLRDELKLIFFGKNSNRRDYYKSMNPLAENSVAFKINELKRKYLKKLTQHADSRDTLNEQEVEKLLQDVAVFIDEELASFQGRCRKVKQDFTVSFQSLDINNIELAVLKFVKEYGGEYTSVIHDQIVRREEASKGKSCDAYIRNVLAIVRSVIEESYREKTNRDYFQLFEPIVANTDNVRFDLARRGVLSPALLDFFQLYLNKDFLAKADEYHERELSRYFECPDQSKYRVVNIECDPQNPNAVFLRTIVTYRQIKFAGKTYEFDVLRRETLIRIEDKGEEFKPQMKRVDVALVKSDVHIYHKGLRREYLLKRLKEDRNETPAILFKMAHSIDLSPGDLHVIEKFLDLTPWGANWHDQLYTLSQDSHADDLFLRAWTDEQFFENLFDARQFENKLDRAKIEDPHSATVIYHHLKIVQKLCETAEPQNRLLALKARHISDEKRLDSSLHVVDRLMECLALVQNQNWYEIANKLNDPASRDLMMSAMHSLQDPALISVALSYPRILYSLDADTLTYFALKEESIARRITHQSIWQRIGVKIRQYFFGEKYLEVPADRLEGGHVAQLLDKYPQLTRGPLKEHSDFYCQLTGSSNLINSLDVERDIYTLSTKGSKESRRALAKAVKRNSHLTDMVYDSTVDNVAKADARVNITRDLGLKYLTPEDQAITSARKFFKFVFPLRVAKDQQRNIAVSDKSLEDLYYHQFLGLFQTRKGVDRPKGHAALRSEISRLWNNTMKFPREGMEGIAKRAIKRILREHPSGFLKRSTKSVVRRSIANKVPEAFYFEVFRDGAILRNFLEDKQFMKDFAADASPKLQQHVLRLVANNYRASEQGFSGQVPFTLKHLDEAYRMFYKPDTEIYTDETVCRGYIDIMLHHHDNVPICASIVADNITTNHVTKLLEHATPFQLIEFLLRNSDLQARVRKQCELNQDAIVQERQDTRKLPIEREASIEEHTNYSTALRRIARFFTLAVTLIRGRELQFHKKVMDPTFPNKAMATIGQEAARENVESLDSASLRSCMVSIIQQCEKSILAGSGKLEVGSDQSTLNKQKARYWKLKKRTEPLAEIDFWRIFSNDCLRMACTQVLPLKRQTTSADTPSSPSVQKEAMSNIWLRQLIWTLPKLQRSLAKYGDLDLVLLFLSTSKRSTQVKQADNTFVDRHDGLSDRTVTNWEEGLLGLLRQGNEALVDFHWSYLLENVPRFAEWFLSQAKSVNIDLLNIKRFNDLIRFKINGYDFLILLEREYKEGDLLIEKRSYYLRGLLLAEEGLLARLLANLGPREKDRESANLMARILKCEVQKVATDNDKESAKIALQLASDESLNFMVNHADADHLMMLLQAKRPFEQQHLPLHPVEKKIIAALRKGYLERQYVRDEFAKSPLLCSTLLRLSSDSELMTLVQQGEIFGYCILNDQELFERYLKLSEVGAVEQLYAFVMDKMPQNWSGIAENLLPKILAGLDRGYSSSLLLKILPSLIYQVRSNSVLRDQVDHYLRSQECSVKLRKADTPDLFKFFVFTQTQDKETQDSRAVHLIFFDHPHLADTLMAKCWLMLKEADLMTMMSHQFKPWLPVPKRIKTPSTPTSFDQDMIDTLIKAMSPKHNNSAQRSEVFCARFLMLAKNADFLSALFKRLTLKQLNKLLSTNMKVRNEVVDYFKAHSAEFFAVLNPRNHSRPSLRLSQLATVLKLHTPIADLFIQHVKQEYLDLSKDPRAGRSQDLSGYRTNCFDSIVTQHVKNPEDHESVYTILTVCYQRGGGDFYLNFTVPLNQSLTRMFLIYQFSGGEAISALYNTHIVTLRDVWRVINVRKDEDYLQRLEDRLGKLGVTRLSFDQVASADTRLRKKMRISSPEEGTPSRSKMRPQSEVILYTLYAIVTILRNGYEQFMQSDNPRAVSIASTIRGKRELNKLFSSMLGAKIKWLDPIISVSSDLQLANLADADVFLAGACIPIRQRLFVDASILDRIEANPVAFKVLLDSKAFQKEFGEQPDPNRRIKKFLERYSFGYPPDGSGKKSTKISYLKEFGGNGDLMCSVTEYCAWLAAKEYLEFGRDRNPQTMARFSRGNALGIYTLFSYSAGEFRIRGFDSQPSYNKPIPAKYLSCFFYARFIYRKGDFIKQIESNELYRAAFCQCFDITWSTKLPTGLSTQLAYKLNSFQEKAYPKVILALSGLEPEAEMLVMYCYARSISSKSEPDCRIFALIARDHIMVEVDGNVYFNTLFIDDKRKQYRRNLVPESCLAFLTKYLDSLSPPQSEVLRRSSHSISAPAITQLARQRAQVMGVISPIPARDSDREESRLEVGVNGP